MLQTLSHEDLTLTIDPLTLGFEDTSQCLGQPLGWIGQSRAEEAAWFGLVIDQPGFHLLVLGEPGSGRTSLMLQTIHEVAKQRVSAPDILYVYNFDHPENPVCLRVKTGHGILLRNEMDHFARNIAKALPPMLTANPKVDQATVIHILPEERVSASLYLAEQIEALRLEFLDKVIDASKFTQYTEACRQDILDNLEMFQQGQQSGDNESMLEAFLSRYRINLIVDNRPEYTGNEGFPVVYDDDPSFQSLFGGIENASDNAQIPDFLKLYAGNILRADGGVLVLHLRDIQAEQQTGGPILEKLHRFLRNNRVQIEEPSGSSGNGNAIRLKPEAIATQVKLVLIASREEYYRLHEDSPDLAIYFRIKVDFAESFIASQEIYQAISTFVASRCEHFKLPHFTASAVARLICNMHRWIEDKHRLSSNFGELQRLMLESAAMASLRHADKVDCQDVDAATRAQLHRYQYPEQQLSDAIIEGELLIRVQGREIGQINGLTHIDMGDAGFGSPIRISARCFAGEEGVMHIDREVEMSGPNHDKGLLIMQSWLSASFGKLAPLCLNAYLTLEQEYSGVEGDSASCAELYALLSALSGLPLPQGIAVTGAMNQHGEVMAIGGVNEKIEGYFRVCKQTGLDGKQGILIPERNKRHLMLDDEIKAAVQLGQFHIHTMSHVLEGIEHLTGMAAGTIDEDGYYRGETVMGRVQRTLEQYRKSCDSHPRDRDN